MLLSRQSFLPEHLLLLRWTIDHHRTLTLFRRQMTLIDLWHRPQKNHLSLQESQK
jgi:hypothetical protein